MKGKVVVFYNLKPRPLAGVESNGMVLCTSNADHTKIELLRPDDSAELGDRIGCSEIDVEIEELKFLNSKKVKKFLKELNTDETGTPRYGERPLCVKGKGLIKSSLTKGSIS